MFIHILVMSLCPFLSDTSSHLTYVILLDIHHPCQMTLTLITCVDAVNRYVRPQVQWEESAEVRFVICDDEISYCKAMV